ncbi:hypothetical protein D917_10173 [Trichinella nativa]|uniref:Uncharacterized protein n=1 Tax=Trichinella nativa TaxID=6335 RepID=A0A1Y3EIG1_9BILA|nr:hypothetical protein D917_10173 [Trichinella nativa]
MAQIFQNIRNDIWNVIGDESRLVGKLFAKFEQKTGKSRYQAAVMLAIPWCSIVVQLHMHWLSSNEDIN